MPRPLRIEYPGAWYHVMNRGINRMKIFCSDEDRNIFLNLLKEISVLFQVEIHSYCLMDNHFHLLLQTPHPNLGKAMRHLSGLYTLRHNRALNRDGPLFRGRYKAILIEEDNYLLQVSRYIHLNPIEAQITKHPQDFKWSSYNDYINPNKSNWVYTSFILDFFGSNKNYAEFVAEGNNREIIDFYNKSQIPSILGTQKFITEKIDLLKDDYKLATQADVNRTQKSLDIQDIASCVAAYFNVPIEQLKIAKQKNNIPRLLAIYLARNLTQHSNQKISEYFTGIKRFSVSTRIIKCRELIKCNSVVNMHYFALRRAIANEL